jgi:hypothetical protein
MVTIPVKIPSTALKRFQAARYWIDTRSWEGLPTSADKLQNAELALAMTWIREKEIRTAAHKDAEVTKPDKLSCCQNGLEGSQ